MKTNLPISPIERACEIAGSQAALAGLVGVHSSLPSQWKSGHRPISPECCVAIERATAGAVTRQDLRPDDWMKIWPELAEKKAA